MLLTVPAVARVGHRLRQAADRDTPAKLLALATAGLSEHHREWGRAMDAELATVCGVGERWRFSVGGVRAAGLIRAHAALTSRERGGASLRATVGAALLAAVALVGYGLVRYPGLRSSDGANTAAVTFVAVLVGYGAVMLTLSRGTGCPATAARRYGVVGGVTIGVAWLVVLYPTGFLKEWVLVPLLVALLAPAAIAARAARAGGEVRAGSRAALWSGIVGALIVFTVSMTAAYVHDGRPYDPQLLRDFRRSGAPDLATLSVTDHLASALTMLVLIPLAAVAFGSLGARLPRGADPTSARASGSQGSSATRNP